NTYAYVAANPLKYADPKGLVYGYGSSPYGTYYAAKPDEKSEVATGAFSYLSDLTNGFNPYEKGSCEYFRREAAIKGAEELLEVAAKSPTVREYITSRLIEIIQANPEYYAGRVLANTITAAIINKVLKRGKNGTIPQNAALGAALTSKATYSAIIEMVEENIPECPCEK
ncbi:hypothetical protein, partial [Zooshikella harenae]